jgi:hypothetical protein
MPARNLLPVRHWAPHTRKRCGLQLEEAGHAEAGRLAVLLSVRDTGGGMDEKTRSRIFEPYFTTNGEKGTGLGLSTVYGIVEQSGGRIDVESQLERGSRFAVYLPRAEGHPDPVVEPQVRRLRRPRRKGRVLLVENDAAARQALEELLSEEGYAVLSAGTGDEAERLYRRNDPIDVVVTDTVMPRMSGPELVERLRTLQPGAP